MKFVAKQWESLFGKQQILRYGAEDKDRLQFDRRDKKSLVDALCVAGKSSSLEPPGDFFFLPLRQFLDEADPTVLDRLLNIGSVRVLLDERQDDQSSTSKPRVWDTSDNSYLLRPTPGLRGVSSALDLQSLYSTLSENASTSLSIEE